MWLINGPFDCAQVGDEGTLKTKLLKANSVYGVGRHPDTPLWINNKKISRQNGQFIVGEHSEDDVSNGALVPTLSLRNNKTTALKISRGESVLLVNPESTHELESGDIIMLTSSITLTVTWQSVVCFHADALSTVDLAACASIGLKVVTKHSRDVTHHLLPSLTTPVTPAVLYTLLVAARFVTPSWLADLIRVGSDTEKGLEKTYDPPLESGFRPEIDGVLTEKYPKMANKAAWGPNDDRKGLFVGMSFVFVVLGSGAGTECKKMADIVSRGGATRQLVNIEKEVEEQANGSPGAWGMVRKKRKAVHKKGMQSGLVLVGEEETYAPENVSNDVRKTWEAIVEKAKSLKMRIVHPSRILEAVFSAEVSGLDCVLDDDTPASQGASTSKTLPDHIPSTHPEETSQLGESAIRSGQASAEASQTSGAGPSRRLTRRAVSRTPAPEPAMSATPMEVEAEPAAPPPRMLLKRRAGRTKPGSFVNELLGLDDSIILPEESQPGSQSQSRGPEIPLSLHDVPPTPARPVRLTRRAGTAAIAKRLFPDLSGEQTTGEEPPLKKFKALFETSGQGGTDQPEQPDGITETQLQVLREEEEEEEGPSQRQDQAHTQSKKRKAGDMDADVETQGSERPVASKRRAVERSQQTKPVSSRKAVLGAAKPIDIENKPKSGKKGAAPGKPDTDPSFLRAIASTKRGKKTEDEFDREFNKLRIARPDITNTEDGSTNRQMEWGKEWDGLDDFEKDVGLRGNFMEIVEMEVFHDRQEAEHVGRNIRRESGLGARVDWDGREDFKKFRRKMNIQPRPPVQLVARESQDLGGPPYRNSRGDGTRGFDDMSQSQENVPSQPSSMLTQNKLRKKSQTKQGQSKKGKGKDKMEISEDDEVETALGNVAYKRNSKAPGPGKKSQALFDPGSDEEDDDAGAASGGTIQDEDDDVDLTLQSDKRQKRPVRGTKRKAVVHEESDSDEMNFGGFTKKARRVR